ncbi:MAG TPA: AmmeMemoRadiSam system protein B [Patescibacteria group bacterium]|nr:AmmeMemoRadiSam system protein B [Patescibacteria group bacterium]
MPLVFGAICPHPPILIPNIGQENFKKLKKTKVALEELEGDLYSKKPDTIIVVSPHGRLMDETFTINHSPVLKADFEDFGDLETKMEFKNDLGLAYQLRERLESRLPVALTTEEKLDHGTAVPLYYLSQHLSGVKIIPVGYCLQSLEKNFEFGREIGNQLAKTNKRVAVIASGDLSHRLTAGAPAGYSDKGKEFDDQIKELLKQNKTQEILNLNPDLIEEAGQCGLRSIVILLGAFDGVNYQPEILSYEGPFGVGYLVANFKL